MARPNADQTSGTSLAATPLAIFGIDNSGFGVAANLLVLFLFVIWLALIYWTYADARRRVEDPVLGTCAVAAALLFPFAGSLVYLIVRPPETLDEQHERELDMRAAALRVELLEKALKPGSPNTLAATVAGELSGEPVAKRPSAAPPQRRAEPRGEQRQEPRPARTDARPKPAEAFPPPVRRAAPPVQKPAPRPPSPGHDAG